MNFENDKVYLINGEQINKLLDSLDTGVAKSKVERFFNFDLRFTLDTKQEFHTDMIFRQEKIIDQGVECGFCKSTLGVITDGQSYPYCANCGGV